MDVSEAVTSHFNKFTFFHIDLNKYVKLSIASLNYMNEYSNESKALSDKISELIQGAGEKWGFTNYVDPHKEINDLKHQITESAIMRVYSSFEVFLDEITGGYDQFIVNKKVDVSEAKYGHTVLKLFKTFGWNTKKIDYLLPVYEFYNTSRHCVVHQMGRANQELISLSESSEFLDAIRDWPTVIPGNKLSSPPTVKADFKIDLMPHHAITYSDVCYRIASEINFQLINMIGVEYIINYVANDKVLKADKIDYPPCKDVYHYIRHILGESYKIKGLELSKIKDVLHKSGIRKKCFHKHASMVE